MEEQRDEKLWQIARRRAEFMDSLRSYFVISLILWGIWYFTAGRRGINVDMPWPIWPSFFMGVALLIKYLKAYNTDKDTLTQKEYDKLKSKN
ncbi:MAG: 2TM domain-containing protein [Chitinophagaceae bacterium]